VGSQDLQQARYDQLVRRVGALYGGGSKVTEVLPELFPVLDLENLPMELRLLAGWRSAMIAVQRLAGVGDVVSANLFNPVGSGIIAVVERVFWRLNATDDVNITIVQSQLSGGFTKGLFRDSRLGGDRLSTLGATTQTGVATTGILTLVSPADVLHRLEDDRGLFTLSPGNGLQIGYKVVTNKLLVVNFMWRERTAEQSELNF